MNYSVFDLAGSVGVALILISYLLLQLNKLSNQNLAFSVMNAVGSGLILLSLYFDFNFPSVIVEGFWLIISMIGIVKYFINKRGE